MLKNCLFLLTIPLLAKSEKDLRTIIFNKIYVSNHWGSSETRSGPGSEIGNTLGLRSFLPAIIDVLDVEMLLDAGCGDCNWVKTLSLNLKLYVGVDIVKDIVETNQMRFGNEGCRFTCIDIVCDELPQVQAILCRDCLIHMSYEDIRATLRNFKRSGAKYLIGSSYSRVMANPADINAGEWHLINFQIAPFNFPEPIIFFSELSKEQGAIVAGKRICVWYLDEIQID